ncbi:MAG: chromosome segregation protein SMC [Gammaproteobacteria bacterium]|nr:chromosome segregation protein SMC [Gammaproteobacteria bacterium]MYE29228.1 chromosome segregation protein SMC [Gammaproteobacteria bacterium]
MRLKCIRLAGFKSFVDPTTINFPSNICAVVGPNGCGKSNVIDAVRWVMGESSPRNLRGEQMADVIFNGSAVRNAVGLASVELVFDNPDNRLQGEYAGYAEISIKRKVERGGESVYSLNGTRCRRRDITELFLGTGLGPRSYSIVEQGMISRLIESRPEELRVYIEEAAGISKYRERRKETAARIARTRENLERLADVRGELQRQLEHLERQSRAAQRYRELMEEQRTVEARLHALQWQGLAQEMNAFERTLAELETRKEKVAAGQLEEEAAIEQSRAHNAELNADVSDIQGRSIQIGNDIARIEQSIEHHGEKVAQLGGDLEKTRGEWRQTSDELDSDLARVTRIERELEQISVDVAAAEERESESSRLAGETESRQQLSQRQWDDFSLEAETPRQTAEVEQSRIRQFENSIERARQSRERLQSELAELDTEPGDIAGLERQTTELEEELKRLRGSHGEAAAELESTRKLLAACGEELDRVRSGIREAGGRKASLDALQQAALGSDDAAPAEWLKRQGLEGSSRLGESLRIEPGWETAVEFVLGDRLRGICLGELPDSLLADLPRADLTLLDAGDAAPEEARKGLPPLLAGKVESSRPLDDLLRAVHGAGSLKEALAVRGKLRAGESVICPEGVWIATGWIRIGKADREQSVVLRQSVIDSLQAEIVSMEEKSGKLEKQREQFRRTLAAAEEERERCLELLHKKTADLERIRAEISAENTRIKGNIERRERIEAELGELRGQIELDRASAEESGRRLQEARDRMKADAGRRQEYAREREQDRKQLEEHRTRAASDKDELHKLALKKNELGTQLKSTRENMDRMAVQVQRDAERIRTLEAQLEETREPGEQLRKQLQEKLKQAADVEKELREARTAFEAAEEKLKARELTRRQLQQRHTGVLEEIQRHRIENERAAVKSEDLLARLEQAGLSPRQVLDDLPEDQTAQSCEELLEKLEGRIQRIGAVNLAAAEEFEQQSERKVWLDKQNDELEKALSTLEDAMRKIDGETRSRFGATLDDINQGLKGLFARLFGGGQAWLELTGEDLLNAGVTIMARPPGKKNVSIHLLSGGEKAMTAIALVFTIFQLNPSPFCMLDEVDAPLDDTNTNRFSALLRELASRVQFILVTHNKISMETANQLLGITMQEAGISRVVSVDIDEAAEMATS